MDTPNIDYYFLVHQILGQLNVIKSSSTRSTLLSQPVLLYELSLDRYSCDISTDYKYGIFIYDQ